MPLGHWRGAPIRDLEVEVNDRCFSIATTTRLGNPRGFVYVCVVSDFTARKASERERETLLEHTEYARRDAERLAERQKQPTGEGRLPRRKVPRAPDSAQRDRRIRRADLARAVVVGPSRRNAGDLEKIRRAS